MTVDMGGIAWPIRGATASSGPQVGTARLDRQLAYSTSHEPLVITATGTDGNPYSGPLDVVLTSPEQTVTRSAVDGKFSPAGIPAGKYRVTVGGVVAGNLRVL